MNYLWVIICQSIVGSSYPIVQEAMDSIPEFVFACITLGIASLLLMPIASKLEGTQWTKLGQSNWRKLGVQSLCVNVLYSVFLFFALTHASATVSGIFTGLGPAVVFLIAPLIIKEKLTLKKGLSIAVAAVVSSIAIFSNPIRTVDIIGLLLITLSIVLSVYAEKAAAQATAKAKEEIETENMVFI